MRTPEEWGSVAILALLSVLGTVPGWAMPVGYDLRSDEAGGSRGLVSAEDSATPRALLGWDGPWAPNVRVNDDVGTREQSSPSIAVDRSGNAYAVWEDDRNWRDDI